MGSRDGGNTQKDKQEIRNFFKKPHNRESDSS